MSPKYLDKKGGKRKKHCVVRHEGETNEFKMKILRSFNSCLDRQVNEAVRIIITKADIGFNSKSEFCQAPIIRVVLTTGLQEEQEGGRIHSWGRGQGVGARGLARGTGGYRWETRLPG